MGSKEETIRFLGEGAYGTVDLVRYTRRDGSSFQTAVKSSGDYQSLLKEVEILCELSGYPGIVQCFGNDLEASFTCSGRKVYKLCLEYASERSLRTFMENHGKLSDSMIRDFTRMILQGLVSIHGHGYVHCDLKSDNLLIFPLRDDISYELKISDFGNSLEVGEIPDYWETDFPFVGTPIYMPPESLHDGVAEKTLDLWLLGCIVLEMYTEKNPWSGVEVVDLMPLLFDGNAPEIPESLPCDARDFIEICFSRNPEERGTATELLSHQFLRRETKIVVVEEKRKKLRFKVLKLKIKRYSNKLKIFPSKSPQIKKTLIKFLRLKRFL